jgi:serine/threonine-protein kinase
VAYVATAPSSISNTLRLYIRALDQREPTLLSTSARTPFFSPDGEWVGFVEGNNRLSKVALTGGPSFPIGVIGSGIRGASWGSDDTIVFATEVGSSGLLRIPAAGGNVEVLTTPDLAKGEVDHLYPDVLPGARSVLFTIQNNQGADHSRIAVLDLETRTWRVLIEGGSHPRYIASGHIVYGAAGTLRAVAFDLSRQEVRGTPVPVLEGVVTQTSGAASFSVSPDGTLVYVRGRARVPQQTLVWVDRMGREEPLGMEPRLYSAQAVSPDGTRVAVTIEPGDGIEADVWVWSLLRRTMTRLTSEPGEQRFPVWTPDGTRIAYASTREGLFWRPADGTGVAERLLEQHEDTERVMVPVSWSADGRLLFAKQDRATGSWDLGVLQVAGDRTATPLLANPAFDEQWASVSPDGRWMAYESFESARFEIYVRPFPNVDAGKWQVSSDGGFQPTWSADGRTLFFRGTDGLMATTIQVVPTFTSAAPQRVLTREDQGWYSVSRDGTRFLMLKDAGTTGDEARPELNVILNWHEELKRLAPL